MLIYWIEQVHHDVSTSVSFQGKTCWKKAKTIQVTVVLPIQCLVKGYKMILLMMLNTDAAIQAYQPLTTGRGLDRWDYFFK